MNPVPTGIGLKKELPSRLTTHGLHREVHASVALHTKACVCMQSHMLLPTLFKKYITVKVKATSLPCASNSQAYVVGLLMKNS